MFKSTSVMDKLKHYHQKIPQNCFSEDAASCLANVYTPKAQIYLNQLLVSARTQVQLYSCKRFKVNRDDLISIPKVRFAGHSLRHRIVVRQTDWLRIFLPSFLLYVE